MLEGLSSPARASPREPACSLGDARVDAPDDGDRDDRARRGHEPLRRVDAQLRYALGSKPRDPEADGREPERPPKSDGRRRRRVRDRRDRGGRAVTYVRLRHGPGRRLGQIARIESARQRGDTTIGNIEAQDRDEESARYIAATVQK